MPLSEFQNPKIQPKTKLRPKFSSSQSYHSKTSKSSKASTLVRSMSSGLKSLKKTLSIRSSTGGQSVKLDDLKFSEWKNLPPLNAKLSSKWIHDKSKAVALSKWVCVTEFSPTPTEVPIWVSKFSTCGRLLATAGEDGLIFIWTLQHFR